MTRISKELNRVINELATLNCGSVEYADLVKVANNLADLYGQCDSIFPDQVPDQAGLKSTPEPTVEQQATTVEQPETTKSNPVEPPKEEKEPDTTVTADELKSKMMQCSQASVDIKALLNKYGAAKLSAVKEADRADLYIDARKALGEI